ncbi:MAG: Na+/H+ antiporter NhaC family protein [Candidatus Fimisoma sp.]
MELYIAFGVFIATMLTTIATGHSMIIALLVGLVAFLAVGRKRGFSLKSMMLMSRDTLKDALLVVKVMLIIGALTAVWRVSGTIIIFVYYGMKIIMPPIFLLVTFLLCCLLSYAIGTSFGVASTVGVIFMALAESGGVNPLLAGGAVMSGIYFGDRCSPVSSSANMVAGITGTQIYDNVKMMLKTGLLPFLAALAVYVVMSVTNPMNGADSAMMTSLEEEFTLSLWAFIPAIIIIGLPLLKVGVIKAMAASIVSGVLIAWLVQGETLLHIARVMVLGYESSSGGISSILEGGGLVSMLEVAVIVGISSMYSGIFSGTHMLDNLQEKLGNACTRFGRFSVMLMMSVAMSSIFCNQTVGTLMCSDMLKKPYLDGGGTKEELAIDMENSVILIACMLPWTIGCSVPLALLGVDMRALPFAVFMYAVPICYFFTKKKWFSN